MLAATKQDLPTSALRLSLHCMVFESVRNISLSDSRSVMAIWQPCDLVTANNRVLESQDTIYI